MVFNRAALIYNPTAGGGAGGKGVPAIQSALEQQVRRVVATPTTARGHAVEIARNAQADGCDLVAVYGGDGTVNEVVQGLASGRGPSLLVLPGGTANVLVNEVGLPTDPVKVARALPTLAEHDVPLGRVDFERTGASRYFLLMCGVGLDAEVASNTSTKLKLKIGEGAYWVSGLKQVFQPFPKLHIVNGQPLQPTSFVLISKSRMYGGGLVITPGANLLSDHFHIADFSGTNRGAYVGYLAGVVCGAARSWPGIEHYAGDDVTLAPADDTDVLVQVDGEVAGSLPARVTMRPETLPVLLPPDYCVSPIGLPAQAMPAHG